MFSYDQKIVLVDQNVVLVDQNGFVVDQNVILVDQNVEGEGGGQTFPLGQGIGGFGNLLEKIDIYTLEARGLGGFAHSCCGMPFGQGLIGSPWELLGTPTTLDP